MKRKLVRQGAATMMISLPSKWIKENKLGKGDEVELEEQENKLTISLNPKDQFKETEVSLQSLDESSIRTILTNIYRQGYDKVKINFKDKAIIKIMESQILIQLLGFEIIKKTDNFCIIENVTEPSKEQFENIFSKMILNIDELLDLTKKALEKEDYEGFKQVEEKIKQFDNFCRRIISKEEIEHEDLQSAFHQEIMHAQRNLYYLLVFMSKNKTKSGKEEIKIFGDCKKMFEMLKEVYIKKELSIIEKMHEFEKESYERGYHLMNKGGAVIAHHLLNATRGFYLAASPLVCLAADKSLASIS